jgi:peptide deformylase
MSKTIFSSQEEFSIYKEEQKIRMEKGYLTVSERKIVNQMLDKNYKPQFAIIEPQKNKVEIITNRQLLSKPCDKVKATDIVDAVIKDLKKALNDCPYSVGFTANQIGYNKRVSVAKIIERDPKTQQFQVRELVLINAKIIAKEQPYKFKEACMSFPKIVVQTKRYRTVSVEFENEKKKQITETFYDYNAAIITHEIDHQNGKTIFDNKWISK